MLHPSAVSGLALGHVACNQGVWIDKNTYETSRIETVHFPVCPQLHLEESNLPSSCDIFPMKDGEEKLP